jgi:alpha-2-macroglobulin
VNLARRPIGACLAAALFILTTAAGAHGAADGRMLAAADLHYRQKSYSAALREYRAALKSGAVPARRADEVEYRIAAALGKTHQWDRALALSLAFVQSHQHSAWEPRGLYQLGRLYLALPHEGYRVGRAVYRGDNVPKSAPNAGDRPVRVSLAEQDRRDAREALEAARVLYPRFQSGATVGEEILLDFDLAHVLDSDAKFSVWQAAKKWPDPADPALAIRPDERYTPEWPPPKKILTLYAHIRLLAAAASPTSAPPRKSPSGTGRDTPSGRSRAAARSQAAIPSVEARRANAERRHWMALSLLDEALWLRSYQAAMRSQYAIRYVQDKPLPMRFPYDRLDPLDRLRTIDRAYPNDPIHDQTAFLLGAYLQQDGKLAAAAAEYRRLIARRPRIKWASDCRLALAGLAHRSLAIASSPVYFPGRPASIDLTSRNLGRVRFQLYRVPLERVIGQSRRLDDPKLFWMDTGVLLGGLKRARSRLGAPIAEWPRALVDRGDYQPQTVRINVPLRATGAYLLVASAAGIRTARLIQRTSLVLIQKPDRDRTLFFAADAISGRPAPGVRVIAREWYSETNKKGEWSQHVVTLRGQTGVDGTASLPVLRRAGRSNFQIEAFGWRGSDYALTQQYGCAEIDDNQGRFKTYGTTDRSVYRPLQTVQFREIVMERRPGRLQPLVGRRIHVQVFDARSRRIYATLATSSEFGSVNGHFALPADAPLGEYQVRCSVFQAENAATENDGSLFRVEEYKKPEFQVTVTPDAARVRLGQPTSALVSAKYYFGGPAAGARVSYRVYRNAYAQSYKFPQPFDFLYDSANQGSYDNSFRNGEVVAQGAARTDDKGEAKISFPTRADGDRWRDQDLSYTVEADVKDSSRCTITGTGAVKATRHDVAVFLNYARGYAHSGDRVPVEIVTLNPSDVPIAVEGVARVYRRPADPRAKERLVAERPMRTDDHGRAVLDWTAPNGGYYRVAFETHDTAGEPVEGSTYVWVAGKELSRGEFLSQGVVLAVEQPYYQEGQAAKLLIAARDADCSVLLTREVNNQILEKRLVRLSGHTAEISIPLGRRDVPNVFISATMVRNGQLYQATQELFVPPVSRLAKVSVQADREKYQPGDGAKLRLLATDWQGRPLRTELAVSISDAALGYIQKDYAPDIRVYYYGDRRSDSIGAVGSTATDFQELGEDTQRAPAYRQHAWVMPDGMGLLDAESGSHQILYQRGRIVDYEGGATTLSIHIARELPSGTTIVMKNRRVEMLHGIGDYLRPKGERQDLGKVAHASGRFVSDMSSLSQSIPAAHSTMSPAAMPSPAGPPPWDPLRESALRHQFLDTAFWTPAVVTDAQGAATVEVTWPDNLTQWRAYTVGSSAAAQVGTAETSVTTRKNLLVRLETPRYFVERDSVVISAIVQNGTEADARVRVRLDLGGSSLSVIGPAEGVATQAAGERAPAAPVVAGADGHDATIADTWVDVPKDGEKRVDWRVLVVHPGTVAIRATAQSGSAADAMEMTVPVLVHGVERAIAASGVLRGGSGLATVPISLPAARKPGASEVVVQVNPSLAAVMVDALPYLNDYPYGCIEQTMSRFLPSVLTARVLKENGYRLEDMRSRMEAVEKQAKAGRGALHVDDSPYTYPGGKPGTEPAVIERWRNPVFDSRALARMISAGTARIRDYQHADGGWGWWKDDASDTWMTAYVVYGLVQARAAGVPFDPSRLRRAEQFLFKRLAEDDDLHEMAFVARVLALEPSCRSQVRPVVTGRLYIGREKLSAYSKALLSLALSSLGERAKAAVLLGNLENTAQIDEAEGTVHWGESGAAWWCWYNDQVETNAAVLQAYLAAEPHSRLAPMLVNWLVNHRDGDNWSSTRETALAVYALSDYIRANHELAPDYTLTLDLGGRIKRSYHVGRENALLFDNRFVVPDALLETGTHPLTISKEGVGACYYNVTTRYFSQEESIPASGNGIHVARRYFRLLPETASGAPQPETFDLDRPNPFLTGRYDLLAELGTDEGTVDTDAGPRYERTALKEGDTVTSGDLIEVELFLDARNDYSYLAFEDVKPAGCEPVEVRSGEKQGDGVVSNFELRDQKVVFFLSRISQGTRSLSYRLRAEAPGTFHALPTNGYAMYAPALRTLSAEQTLSVKDE